MVCLCRNDNLFYFPSEALQKVEILVLLHVAGPKCCIRYATEQLCHIFVSNDNFGDFNFNKVKSVPLLDSRANELFTSGLEWRKQKHVCLTSVMRQ